MCRSKAEIIIAYPVCNIMEERSSVIVCSVNIGNLINKLISIYILQIMVTGLHAFKNLSPTYPLFAFVIVFGNSCPIMKLFLVHSSASCLSMMQISGPLVK